MSDFRIPPEHEEFFAQHPEAAPALSPEVEAPDTTAPASQAQGAGAAPVTAAKAMRMWADDMEYGATEASRERAEQPMDEQPKEGMVGDFVADSAIAFGLDNLGDGSEGDGGFATEAAPEGPAIDLNPAGPPTDGDEGDKAPFGGGEPSEPDDDKGRARAAAPTAGAAAPGVANPKAKHVKAPASGGKGSKK